MTARRFELIVFDWDGTLIDSADAISASICLAAQELGLHVPDPSRARHVIGLALPEALREVVPGISAADVDRLIARYRFHFFARDHLLPLFPGVPTLLETLRGRGHRLAIATGKGTQGLERGLAHTGVGPLFDATRCADRTAPKPDPAMLHELMEECLVDPDRTLMIGDTTHDLAMARAAGVPAVGVTYGAHGRSGLEGVPSLALVDTVEALHTWLARHG